MVNIPTLSQLYSGVLADLETQYGVSIPLFGKNFLRALAAVQAGKLKLQYLALGNVQKNIFIDTADPESNGGTLERFGRVKLGRNPFSAKAGQYQLQITGEIGAIIAAATTFKSNDDSFHPGKLYVLDNGYTLIATTDSIIVRALEAGLDSALNVNDELTATIPIANVNSLVSVLSEIVEPLAAEDIEAYRTAGINSFRLEPQGGAATDYRLWAQDAQGVMRVYPYVKSGATAEINLYVEATIADSTDGKGTPGAGILTGVEDVINFNPDTTLDLLERGRRPMQVIVHYLPITIKNIDIVITGYIGLTTPIQTEILNAISAELSEVRPFIAGADVLENKNDIFDVNRIISIILTAKPGSIFTSVNLKVDSISVPTYTFINGDIPYLNSVTYA